MIHIGRRIKEVFDAQPKGYTADRFAELLNCNRANVYNIFKRHTIDTDLLHRVSIALNHDFFADLSRTLPHSVKHSQPTKPRRRKPPQDE